MSKKKYKYTFSAWGYSDDCAGIDGSTLPDGSDSDEYTDCHNWFELKLNGEVIGQCMMDYDSGWTFRFRSDTHDMEGGKLVCRWNDEPWDPDE